MTRPPEHPDDPQGAEGLPEADGPNRSPANPGAGDDELVPSDDRVIGVALKWSLIVLAVGLGLVALFLLVAREPPAPPVAARPERVEAPAPLRPEVPRRPSVPFTDVTLSSGVDFVHESGAEGEKLLPETMGAGCAVFDADGDGDRDLLFVDSGSPVTGASQRPQVLLYLNDGDLHFTNATAAWSLAQPAPGSYGTGVAVGDVDADGDLDVFVAALGPNRLLRNDGGRFVDVTAAAGIAGGARDWSTSAGFFDADGDADLDLFVASYVQWSRELDLELSFTLNGRDRAYGPPTDYPGAHSRLYRNDGTGRFTDVSEESGILVTNAATGEPAGKALAVTFFDAELDGDLDVFVANDTVRNFFFRNDGTGRFDEVGARSGVGYDAVGAATGAMGVDVGDYRNDGTLAIGIGNFSGESTSFYVQHRPWRFADVAGAEGIGSPSRERLSFGLLFLDADLDGRLDLLQANGHLEESIASVQPSQTYRQPAQLFWNAGPNAGRRFVEMPDEAVGDLATPIVGRGAAHGDLDGDGDLDVVLTQPDERPLVLRNDQSLRHHWLRVELEPPHLAVGAWVELASGESRQLRQVMPTRSYLSQVEMPVTFGLGETPSVTALSVRWPDGTLQAVDVGGLAGGLDGTVRVRKTERAAPTGRRRER